MLVKVLVFIYLCLFSSEPVYSASKVDAARELMMTPFQMEQIQEDLPVSDFVSKNGFMWFVGQRFLWRWQPTKSTLKRVRIIKSSKDHLKSVVIHDNKIFIASNKSLYSLNLAPLNLEKLTPKTKGCRGTLKLASWKNATSLAWVCKNAIFELDLQAKKKELVEITSFAKSLGEPQVEIGPQSVWIARNKIINRYKSLSSNGRLVSKEIYSTSHKIRNLQFESGILYASTRHTVMRFDGDDRLMSPIPVEGRRKLVLMNLNSQFHTYLFSDKSLEVYMLSQGQSKRVKMPFERVKRANKMELNGSFLGMILDGRPRIFQLSGRW